jgi:hypothetical protein
MTTVDQFLDALAQVESSNNDRAWGDGDRAVGRWQVHIDRLWSEARTYGLEPKLGERFNDFVRRVLTAIYNHWAEMHAPFEIAMYWHLGHWTTRSDPNWDRVYEAKFNNAMARALGQAIT